MSYRAAFRKRARRRLTRLAQSDPRMAESIFKKIEWLALNVREIAHERMKGHDEFSLHVGQYRVLYTIDHERQTILVEDIGKHNAAYRRLRQR